MKLTKGGVYLLKRTGKESFYQDEEIFVQIKTIFGKKTVESKQYLKCECIDGLGEEVILYLELDSKENRSLVQKDEVIMIQDYINEKKSESVVIVLVTKFKECQAKKQSSTGIELPLAKRFQALDETQLRFKKSSSIEERDLQMEVEEKLNLPKQDDNEYYQQQMKHMKQQPPKEQPKLKQINDNYSNFSEINKFGGKSNVGALSDQLNKQTLTVSQLYVGLDRLAFKFEGKVEWKSDIKYGQGDSKYFYIKAEDSNNSVINMSFWSSVEETYQLIQVNSIYYFIGGEVNKFNEQLELKFKKNGYSIIPKQSINSGFQNTYNMTSSVAPIEMNKELKNVQFSNNQQQQQNGYRSYNNQNQGKNVNNQQQKKQLMQIQEVMETPKQYLSTLACVVDIQQGEKNIKLRIKDNHSDYELAVMIFFELFDSWKDRFEMNKWYYFYEFAKQNYQDNIQLKNNKHSFIQVADEQKKFIVFNPEQGVFQKTIHQNQKEDQKPMLQTKQYSNSNNQNQDYNKVTTVKNITEQAQSSSIGQRKEFIVYGYLVSIQLKNKLYYYRCPCQPKPALKFNGDSYFCESCQKFVNPLVQLMLRAFVQDSTGTIPVMIFDQQSSQLINQIDPDIQISEAGQYVKNCIENGQEDVLRQLFSKLDYLKYKFEIQFENKEFNNEQEITYKVLKIDKDCIKEESKYLLKQIETVISQIN